MKLEWVTEKLQKLGKDRFFLLFLAGLMLVVIAVPVGGTKPTDENEKKVSGETSGLALYESEANVGNEGEKSSQSDASAAGADSMEVYRKNMCQQLQQFLQNIEGVGKTEVYITMRSSSEIIVERNSPYTRRSEEETTDGNTRIVGETENASEVVLIEKDDGSQAPIVVKEMVPVVEGVVVAAQGGDNEWIKKEITEMLMALFGIGEHKIRIVKLST